MLHVSAFDEFQNASKYLNFNLEFQLISIIIFKLCFQDTTDDN